MPSIRFQPFSGLGIILYKCYANPGLGEKIIEKSLKCLRSMSLRINLMVLSVFSQNLIPAIFYEHCCDDITVYYEKK